MPPWRRRTLYYPAFMDRQRRRRLRQPLPQAELQQAAARTVARRAAAAAKSPAALTAAPAAAAPVPEVQQVPVPVAEKPVAAKGSASEVGETPDPITPERALEIQVGLARAGLRPQHGADHSSLGASVC